MLESNLYSLVYNKDTAMKKCGVLYIILLLVLLAAAGLLDGSIPALENVDHPHNIEKKSVSPSK